MDTHDFRRLGHELIDWVADYRERIAEYPVMSRVRPGEVAAKLPAEPPRRAEGLATISADLERIVLPGITHWNHPGWFAYFPSNTDLSSVLADLVSSGLGVQGMSWQTSPAATEVEDVVMEWLRQMLGLSDAFTGVIHDTASTATLCALLCARERSSNFSQDRGGLQAEEAPLVVYASDQAHSSVPKAAHLAGFGATGDDCPDAAKPALADLLDAIRSLYTMAREREIHRQFALQPDEATAVPAPSAAEEEDDDDGLF